MNLSDTFIEEMIEQFGTTLNGIDFYEDYAFVLDELSKAGVETAKCDVWCDKCEEELFEVEVDTKTYEWTCPKCGEVNDQ